MLKNTVDLSLQSLASNALERLQKNKAKAQELKLIAKPVADDACYRISPSLPPLSSLSEDYEERLAIAEYDGHQTSAQAERIAYLDAFVSVLVTLPYDDSKGDWLSHRITTAKKWLLDQDIVQPK